MPVLATTRSRMLALLLVCAALYLVGNGSVSLWDRDEPRYAQTSKQMLESGDWVVPRLLDNVRTAKPIFIYWCQASAMALFGPSEFSARLPSVVAMLLTLALIGAAFSRLAGQSRALWTVFVFATSGLTIAAAKMCVTDSVLLLFVLIAQLCLYDLWRGNWSWAVVLTLGAAVGLAGLTKGPVVLGVMGTTLVALLLLRLTDGRHERAATSSGKPAVIVVKLLVVLAIVITIVAPWLYLIHKREPTFLPTIIGHDVLNRMKTGLEGHTGPPGYYLLTIWATYFPWSLFLPAAIVQGWKRRHVPLVRFSLAAVIGPWVMFEIIQTKLPHYLLPTFPFLAFLTADMLHRAARKLHDNVSNRPFLMVASCWCVLVVLLGSALWFTAWKFAPLPNAAIIALIAISLLSLEWMRHVWLYFRAGRTSDAAVAMGLGMVVVIAIIYGGFFPNAPFLRISPRVADVLVAEGATRPGDAIMIDYKETSLAFYQGGTIRPQRDDRYLESTDPSLWPRWIVVTDDVWQTTPLAIRAQFDLVRRIPGWSYADGNRLVKVLVIRRR